MFDELGFFVKSLTHGIKSAFVIAALMLMLPQFAAALPWDVDMYRQPSLKAGEVGRAPAPNTVPLGHRPFTLSAEEAATALKNPMEFTLSSVWRGRRLWNANCFACHGKTGKGEGPVGPQMAVPNLLTDFYKTRADGHTFAVIHHGGVNMPRYGNKFSENEKWDLVNYLRFLQGRDVQGISRGE